MSAKRGKKQQKQGKEMVPNQIKRSEMEKNKCTNQEKKVQREGCYSQDKKELINVDDGKENRRTSRLTTILAIVAIMGSVCICLLSLSQQMFDMWPESGYVYRIYLWLLFISALVAAFFAFVDIVNYVYTDLKRYNMKDKQYKVYDEKSDDAYERILSNFELAIGGLGVLLLFFPSISVLFLQRDNVFLIVLVFACTAILLFRLVDYLVKQRKIRKILSMITKRIHYWIFVETLLFFMFIYVLASPKSKIDINFGSTGQILVNHCSNLSYDSLKVKIYNQEGYTIFIKRVSKDQLLLAREDQYDRFEDHDGREWVRAIKLSGEKIYWKYIFDLQSLDLEDSKYVIEFTFEQGSRSASISNRFDKDNDIYIFGVDSISKEY